MTHPRTSDTPGAMVASLGDHDRSPEETDMAYKGTRTPTAQKSRTKTASKTTKDKWRAAGVVAMVVAAVLFATLPVVAPAVLSASDLLAWAQSRHGLGLIVDLAWFVIAALDALAIACILITLVCAILDKPAGIFAGGAWVIAGVSAMANYRYGTSPDAPTDRWWFFPIMSILGPIMMHGAVKLIRRIVQEESERRATDPPKFGTARWLLMPKVTYGAYRTAQVLQIKKAEDAIRAYHELCPTGSVRVVAAIRARDAAEAARVRDRAEWEEAQERARAEWEAERARKDADRAANRASRANGPRDEARARADKNARAGRARAVSSGARASARADWWTPAREDFYARTYAARLDAEGVEVDNPELAAGLGGIDQGNARNARIKYLRARYADEYARGARAPEPGVVLPRALQTLVTAREMSGVTDELRAIGGDRA